MRQQTTFIGMTPRLRLRIEKTVENLLSLLDEIDGEADAEAEPLEPYLADAVSDLEWDPAESGIADRDGMAEQWPSWHGYVS